jgi:hypothetical protein
LFAAVDYSEELTGRGPRTVRWAQRKKAGARTESLDAVHAALRAADEIAAALQAHLTQEHGVHVEDRSQ